MGTKVYAKYFTLHSLLFTLYSNNKSQRYMSKLRGLNHALDSALAARITLPSFPVLRYPLPLPVSRPGKRLRIRHSGKDVRV